MDHDKSGTPDEPEAERPLSPRLALNDYHNANTPAEKHAANEVVKAVLKLRQWDWETRD